MAITPEVFRKIALSQSGAEERSHMGHPDFRSGGKIFATLGNPDQEHGMVKLTPELQNEFMKREPEAYRPAAGAWGRMGSTTVTLKAASKPVLKEAIEAAFRIRSEAKAPKKSRSRTV